MRFGRLLFLVHALIGLGPARNNGPRLLVLCRASPPYSLPLPASRDGKRGPFSTLVHFAIHAESCHRDPLSPARVPLSLFASLFLTGDADLVALRLLYTQRDISRHVAPVVRPDVPFVGHGIQGQTSAMRADRVRICIVTPIGLTAFLSYLYIPTFRAFPACYIYDGNVSCSPR